MSSFFLEIVNMSISASWIVLAVLLLRLLLKKAPKWITVLLWGIVAVRLICPISIESAMSLMPSSETINTDIMVEGDSMVENDSVVEHKPLIDTGVPIINDAVNPIIEENFSSEPEVESQGDIKVTPLKSIIPILSWVWVAGMVVMFTYTVISYLRVKNKICTAVLLRDSIYQSENVVSPFVLGVLKPRIYLPFNMDEQDMEHVIAHENAHIRRKDHLWKPFGFLLLTLHWFNPFIWIAYVLLCRDIELACDEKVVKEFDNQQKVDYAQALLTCSVNRRMIAACPIAFGEVGVKDRVKSILNYKKPAFWIIIVAIIASIVVAVCFLTDPVSENAEKDDFKGGSLFYFAYTDYYTDVDDYIEIWDLAGFRHREVGISPFFPQSIDDLNVREFFCRYDQKLPLGEGVQLFLEIQYTDEISFNEELERIKSMSFNCDDYFEDSLLSAYATNLGENTCSEYALIDEEQQVIYYIHLKDLPKDEIELDLKYVPIGYTGYGEITDNRILQWFYLLER